MTLFKHITSVTNPLIKEITTLAKKNKKSGKQQYILEGKNFVLDLIQHNRSSIEYIFVTKEHISLVSHISIENQVIVVTETIMQKISNAKTPQGILALCNYTFCTQIPSTPAIVCFEIHDPGNLGTLLRTAASFNVKTVICIGGVYPLNQKVVQACAGTLSQLKIYMMTEEQFFKITKNSEIIALSSHTNTDIKVLEKNKHRFLIIGNESRGIPEHYIKKCTTSVSIKMPGNVESLNAAIAGAIAMYELF